MLKQFADMLPSKEFRNFIDSIQKENHHVHQRKTNQKNIKIYKHENIQGAIFGMKLLNGLIKAIKQKGSKLAAFFILH